jgi:cellulose synthase/poly-beta-1,6-N-acetylglucosamine synthase-like glycosyltransferase
VLVTLTLTALTALLLATPPLFVLGHRWRASSRALSCTTVCAASVISGEIAGRVFALPSRYVVVAEAVLVAVGVLIAVLRPLWNPIGHVFFQSFVVAAGSYLVVATHATFAADLSIPGTVASFVILMLEVFAIVISASFAFESIDVACRSGWARPTPRWGSEHRPFVSLHVPAYNEPPEMLIETIRSLEAIDYPDFEIVVIDNNTEDEDVWRPVEAYCAERPRVRFVHVAPWPGFKSGALNLVLRKYTDQVAEVVGVVDADYLVRSDYLRSLVGYFTDPKLAFVQTPQDYREYTGDTYLTACYDSYKYFFETAMPSRNERNSIIFGGTMGLIRRAVLEELGGWDERCITEDAEASLRMLRAGYSGLYVNETYGQGIMPLTFTALKKQRFRWCFGGIQILRTHWRSLLPWDRRRSNHLSFAQRIDYLLGGLQWFGDLAALLFTLILISSAALYLTTGDIALRALTGALVAVPVALIATGLLRALWALRSLTGISIRRAALALATWLSLSWTTALACLRGLTRRDGVFLRTPKWRSGGHLIEALRETRTETAFAAGLALLSVGVGVAGGRWLLAALAGWQALAFGTSPYMAWLNQRTDLSSRLARRARSEDRRDRVVALAPTAIRTGAFALAAMCVVAIFVVGGADDSGGQATAFHKPTRHANDQGPVVGLVVTPNQNNPDPPVTTTTPATKSQSGASPPTAAPATVASTPAPTATSQRGATGNAAVPATTPTTTATSLTTVTPNTSPTPSTSGPPATRPSPPTSATPPGSGPPTSHPGRP